MLVKRAKKGGRQEGKKNERRKKRLTHTSEVFNKFGLALTYRLSIT